MSANSADEEDAHPPTLYSVTSAPVKPFSHKVLRRRKDTGQFLRAGASFLRCPSWSERNRSFNLDFRQFYGSTTLNLRVSKPGGAGDMFGDKLCVEYANL